MLYAGPTSRRGRAGLLLTAALFAMLTRYIYADVIGGTDVFAYMGVRVADVPASVQVWFLAIAVLPAVWLPVHLRQPSDLLQLFLYFAVHIPTAVMMPLVSAAPLADQATFCLAITAGLLALDLRRCVPPLRAPGVPLTPAFFWAIVAAVSLLTLVVFLRSGYLSPGNLSLVNVYERRIELADRRAEVGALFFYLANWTGVALAPFLLVAGLHTRRTGLLAAGILIAGASFVASSSRLNYMVVPAVIGGYGLLRFGRGRHFGAVLGLAFAGVAVLLLAVDAWLAAAAGGPNVPVATWQVFHRTFSNNGFLSAVYLDVFRELPPGLWGDSFLRWLPGPSLGAVAVLAGESFTDVPDVVANANLWANGFANLGYGGLLFAALSTAAVLWVYDGVASRTDPVVAAAALIGPASIIANTATHTALSSNGFFFVFLLIWAWPGGRTRPAVAARGRAAVASG